MNLLKKKNLMAVASFILAAGAQTAIASSSAQATINWDSFNVQLIDLSSGLNAPVFNWLTANGGAYSYANTTQPYDLQNDGQSASDYSTTLSTNTVTAEAQSSTLRNAAVLQANAASQPGTGNISNNYAYAGSYNYGNFGLAGHGIALITMDWNVSGTGVTNDSSEYSYASANIYGNFSDGNYSSGSATSSYGSYTTYNDSFSQNGTFSLAIFGDGTNNVTGSINAQAYAQAYSPVSQVPLPSAVWLFLSALMGVLGFTQRKVASVA